MDSEQKFALSMASIILIGVLSVVVSMVVASIHSDITELRIAEVKEGK